MSVIRIIKIKLIGGAIKFLKILNKFEEFLKAQTGLARVLEWGMGLNKKKKKS